MKIYQVKRDKCKLKWLVDKWLANDEAVVGREGDFETIDDDHKQGECHGHLVQRGRRNAPVVRRWTHRTREQQNGTQQHLRRRAPFKYYSSEQRPFKESQTTEKESAGWVSSEVAHNSLNSFKYDLKIFWEA